MAKKIVVPTLEEIQLSWVGTSFSVSFGRVTLTGGITSNSDGTRWAPEPELIVEDKTAKEKTSGMLKVFDLSRRYSRAKAKELAETGAVEELIRYFENKRLDASAKTTGYDVTISTLVDILPVSVAERVDSVSGSGRCLQRGDHTTHEFDCELLLLDSEATITIDSSLELVARDGGETTARTMTVSFKHPAFWLQSAKVEYTAQSDVSGENVVDDPPPPVSGKLELTFSSGGTSAGFSDVEVARAKAEGLLLAADVYEYLTGVFPVED